ncbi:MAG: HNH endonuclease [Verrucomicrobia bacterium]|nr:MAG: HNH endonuclease [Verrucomicrobiota bacterium]
MSTTHVPLALRSANFERASGRCEYCLVPSIGVLFPHEPDHIIAEQHGGATTLENLALACVHCNAFKGTNLSSVDPETREIVLLYNPRTDRWDDHFRLDGPRILPLTPTGRATARLLRFGDPEREQARRDLWLVQRYPG